jgi:hypothetical protein
MLKPDYSRSKLRFGSLTGRENKRLKCGVPFAAPHRTRLATNRPLVARRFRQTRAFAIVHPVAKKI